MQVEQLIDQQEQHINSTYSAIEAAMLLRIAIIEEEKVQLEAKLKSVTERLDKIEKLIGM